VSELEDIKRQRDAALHFLSGLRNAPWTKHALKKHVDLLEKQIEFFEGQSDDLSQLIQMSKEMPALKCEVLR
jgi:hypothetical protein